MKVLIVANGVVRAGVSRVLSLLSQEWEKEHDVYLSIFRNADPSYPVGGDFLLKGISFRGVIWSQVFHLYKLLKKYPFDRIYGFSEDANYPLSIAARLAGVSDKVVLTVHNPIQKMSAKVQKRITQHYGKVGRVLAVSEGVREGLISLGLQQEKVTFVPNPIDLSMVDDAKKLPPSIELPKDKINVMTVGRLHSHKGFDLLIEAFKRIDNKGYHLWIVGSGDEKEVLEHQIQALSLQTNVTLLGEQENPFNLLAQADFYVMSSRLEGWPLVLMEAMSVGLPVISFDCPNGPDEIIENNKSGILVSCGDVAALSEKMDLLAKNSALRDSLGWGALSRIEDFDVKKVAKQWLEV